MDLAFCYRGARNGAPGMHSLNDWTRVWRVEQVHAGNGKDLEESRFPEDPHSPARWSRGGGGGCKEGAKRVQRGCKEGAKRVQRGCKEGAKRVQTVKLRGGHHQKRGKG